MTEHGIETEVKFRVNDLAALRADLMARGAVMTQQRHLERNTLFDDDGHTLQKRGMLLRLRDALDTVITLKAPAPPEIQSTQHKSRVEIEMAVSDYDAAWAILTMLGYTPSWRYEKYRESFRLDDVTITLDHTPIGDFAEIEGQPETIRPMADRLAFKWDERSLQTYRELFNAAGLTDRKDMLFEPGED
jgi:adenylate cyclase class 2